MPSEPSPRRPAGLGTGIVGVLGVLGVLGLGAAPAPVGAARIQALVVDQKGQPVADAVVVAVPLAGQRPALRPRQAVVDQIDKTFVPHVLPVVEGTPVLFPNKDDIRHHLYSFSTAKTFELPLYEGTPAEPIVFERAGVVVLGCNIHDFMRGYIFVSSSPYFATSGADGRAEVADLPAGGYEVTAWHPREKNAASGQRVETATETAVLDFRLELKPDLKLRRAPTARGREY
jgi:plastocyanin